MDRSEGERRAAQRPKDQPETKGSRPSRRVQSVTKKEVQMDKTKEKSIGTVFLKGEVTTMVAVKSEDHLLTLIEQGMGHSTAQLVRNLLRERDETYTQDVTTLEEECDRLRALASRARDEEHWAKDELLRRKTGSGHLRARIKALREQNKALAARVAELEGADPRTGDVIKL